MKHDRGQESPLGDRIAGAAADAGVELLPPIVEALALHLEAVLRANTVQNLTAISDPEEAVLLHVVDSLLALPEVRAAPAGQLADLGSGAGYPGVPLALAGERNATLVESVGKKAEFLRGVAVLLRSHVALCVEQDRAESLALRTPAAYSVVTARAVTALPSLVELAAPLLPEGGVLVALKGQLTQDELQRGVLAAGMLGMALETTRQATLPAGQLRTIVLFRRTDKVPEVHVPRRPGRAQRKPLA